MLVNIRKYRSWLKVYVIFFAFSVSGVHLKVHFCKGHIAGVNLIASVETSVNSNACVVNGCSSQEDGNCCDDKFVSTSLDYDGASFTYSLDIDIEDQFSNFVQPPVPLNTPSNVKPTLDDRGPPIKGAERRILFQSFLC